MNTFLFTIIIFTFVIGCLAYPKNDICNDECRDTKLLKLAETLPGGKSQAFEILNSYLQKVQHESYDGSVLIDTIYIIIMFNALIFLFIAFLLS